MPFAPSDISGLKIWLKADAGAGSSDGDPVGTWTDQSGTSHDFTQSTSGKKPTYKVNIRNGLPVVRFDGTDDELNGGDLSAVFTTGGSMFCVLKDAGSASNPTSGNVMPYETKNNDPWFSHGGDGYWGIFRSTRLSSTPSSGLPAREWHVWSLTADNGSNYKMYLDSVNKISGGSFTFDGGNDHVLAHQKTSAEFMAMDLGELIVYDSALNDTDRGNVETYLQSRWMATNGTAAPSATAGVGAVPAPTAMGNATAAPSAVAGIGAVPAASAFSAALAQPARVAGIGAVPAPTAIGENKATPVTVAGIGRVPNATATGQGTGGGGGSIGGVTDFWAIKGLS